MPPDDLLHERDSLLSQPVPARLLGHRQLRPAAAVGEHQHDGLGLAVHVVLLLPVGLLQPRCFILGQNDVSQRRCVDGTELANWNVDIHGMTGRKGPPPRAIARRGALLDSPYWNLRRTLKPTVSGRVSETRRGAAQRLLMNCWPSSSNRLLMYTDALQSSPSTPTRRLAIS